MRHALARYAGPVLITSGTQSPPIYRPVIRHVAGLLPQAQRVEYAGAGHIPHVTHPQEFVRTVLRVRVGPPSRGHVVTRAVRRHQIGSTYGRPTA